MKIIEALRSFEITASGGFAIYVLMCVGFVTLVAIYQIGQTVIGLFK